MMIISKYSFKINILRWGYQNKFINNFNKNNYFDAIQSVEKENFPVSQKCTYVEKV